MTKAAVYRRLAILYKYPVPVIAAMTFSQQLAMLDEDGENDDVIEFDDLEAYAVWRAKRGMMPKDLHR